MATIEERTEVLEERANNMTMVVSQLEVRVDALDNTIQEFTALVKEQFSEIFSQLKVASDMLETLNNELAGIDDEEEEDENDGYTGDEEDEDAEVVFEPDNDLLGEDEIVDIPPPPPLTVDLENVYEALEESLKGENND